jgi:hypothetical protein
MKTTTRAALGAAFAAFFLMFLTPAVSRAIDVDFGVRGGLYSDADAGFLGAELLTGVTRDWFFNPNFEYVFVDDGHLYTLNLDAHYDLRTNNPYSLWIGGGPAVIFSEVDPPFGCRRCDSDSETDIGLNLLAGIGFWKRQAIRPYIQGKVTLSDNTEASLGFGVRFY